MEEQGGSCGGKISVGGDAQAQLIPIFCRILGCSGPDLVPAAHTGKQNLSAAGGVQTGKYPMVQLGKTQLGNRFGLNWG